MSEEAKGEGPGEGFLGRWSRRKRAAAGRPAPEAPRLVTPEAPRPVTPEAPRAAMPEAPPPALAGPSPPAMVPAEAATAPTSAEPAFDPASLPPLESLTAESDITAFLRPQVPAALRTAALRRAWTLDPAIRDYVGPADYAWDFNAPDGMAGFSLELGGEVRKLLAQAIGLRDEAEAEAGTPPAAPDPPALADAAPEPLRLDPPSAAVETPPDPAPEPAPVAAAPRRHGGAVPV
ncbi:DUF3306 domain-containing protein [Paracraurococcus lichenis]|uniref:DUF3306 domain-containing protein n=1 Tax=Paracraurococcus lichenis TaxID=3064888 RepID=A0ABT9DWB4_9PROT|nr:DUF3306 domain-containing protein [Paracraurococcus sp. LOR1-02]MDO9708191.1 DUF3306 domain-containing protein [Paracraurococcus sp. LOR1-02]